MTIALTKDVVALRAYGGPDTAFHRELLDLVSRPAYLRREEHYLLGIAGPPLSGAHELADHLVSFLTDTTNNPDTAIAVHMDGFRIPGHQFKQPGKGALVHVPYWAPGSFEQESFCQFVQGIRQRPLAVHTAATYDHLTDQVHSEGIRVNPSHKIVIVESPYLLHSVHPWKTIQTGRLLDRTWFVDAPEEILFQRYYDFYRLMGLTHGEAVRFVEKEDLQTAALVQRGGQSADFSVTTAIDDE
jgi:pantothenate kinase